MTVGIVGSEGAKFTPETEAIARQLIRLYLSPGDKVVSGACHLGGIDRWAIEEAQALGLETQEFPPRAYSWEYGYKPRNILIAHASARVICFTVRHLPQSFVGTQYLYCYHCKTDTHVKSGGCWTVKYARGLGKTGEVVVIDAP